MFLSFALPKHVFQVCDASPGKYPRRHCSLSRGVRQGSVNPESGSHTHTLYIYIYVYIYIYISYNRMCVHIYTVYTCVYMHARLGLRVESVMQRRLLPARCCSSAQSVAAVESVELP